jgi:hypothetical protein
MSGQEDYELIYRSPDEQVSVDVIDGNTPGQKLICLYVDEIEDDENEAGALRMTGHIRRLINRLEAAQEAIERRYRL